MQRMEVDYGRKAEVSYGNRVAKLSKKTAVREGG
jgi:hypothetical protein